MREEREKGFQKKTMKQTLDSFLLRKEKRGLDLLEKQNSLRKLDWEQRRDSLGK